ncbi:MAG: hypothetical protein ABSE69_08455 [Roseiarcus sp.]
MAEKFKSRINPALDRHPKLAAIIGRIVLAYGEIEFSVCRNAGHALNLLGPFLATVYQTRASSARVDFAQSIILQECKELGLSDAFETCRAMVSKCAVIRNQYAHCNWADSGSHRRAGLFFADLENSEFDASAEFFHHYRHVSANLLDEQLSYFAYTMEWLEFLNHEIALRQGRLKEHYWPKPPKLSPPPLHNPPEKHVPPFLTEGQKLLFAQHIEAEKKGVPRPTPGQRAQDKARAAKKAKKEELTRRSQEGERRAKSRSSEKSD